MRTERVEVRLDPATRERLEEMAEARRSSVSELVRSLIDRSYAEDVDRARVAAARRIGELGVEDVPEASVLKEQFARAHDPDFRAGDEASSGFAPEDS